ncbi:hypothetical protein Bca52824_005885 [Brassica carinata]|uniref:Transmembrane protein n=1 Tax=Brassica carinata TaxID=52824 RepID=A0A8X8BH00_BRACI|nr:hypothetical protein Bca52824_005885 [Brassica carinata]
MPTSFMTGSIVGKRFYKKVMTREADDRSGWTVMLDYKTLKTPSKRPLKLPFDRYKSMGLPVWFSSVVLGITLVPCPLLSMEWHWSLDMAIVSSSVVVEDKPRSRTSDVSYEEQDDPDGGLERRSLSGDS